MLIVLIIAIVVSHFLNKVQEEGLKRTHLFTVMGDRGQDGVQGLHSHADVQ